MKAFKLGLFIYNKYELRTSWFFNTETNKYQYLRINWYDWCISVTQLSFVLFIFLNFLTRVYSELFRNVNWLLKRINNFQRRNSLFSKAFLVNSRYCHKPEYCVFTNLWKRYYLQYFEIYFIYEFKQ